MDPGLCTQPCLIEHLPITSGVQVDPFCGLLNVNFRSKENNITNKVGARTQHCLPPLCTGKCFEATPAYLMVRFMLSRKEAVMLSSWEDIQSSVAVAGKGPS
ncbi:hypothetical protein RRG08_031239 [Elysia crispata]|uniref:Uncharacterized protein n=1 Tax=Elysia crispata TaxID=231223 RepID=A0AAE1AJ51_9GAST|nr:hypothetical protein RRG08_031239 [Elysia crispata]